MTLVGRIQALLDELVTTGAEVGAAVSVVRDGAVVADVSAGTRTDAGDPWQPDTLVMTYSLAKPFAALTVLSLVADGLLDVDQRVAEVWPAYGANGKEATTVRHVLSHQAGVLAFPEAAADVAFDDADTLIDALADARPDHPPGTVIGEHALTYGHLCDGIVRHVSGERLVDRFAGIRAEAGWEAHLTVGPQDQARIADVVPLDPSWPANYLDDPRWGPVMSRPAGVLDPATINSTRWRTCSFPAIGLHASASGLATFYGDVMRSDGFVADLLGPDLLAEYTSPQATGFDVVRGHDVAWTLGLDIEDGDPGMGGAGGSAAWYSPAHEYAAAFVTRGLGGHERTDRIWTLLTEIHGGT